jgi:polyhydroxybutyrate depolymerase
VLVRGQSRTYELYVPASYDGSKPVPLVLVFHGSNSSGSTIERWSGFDDLADQAGFIVCYPDGLNGLWNAADGATRDSADDVGFIRSLIETLSNAYRIDPARVFATGMSIGGALCQRLGLELSDKIAAIGPVAGPMGEPLASEQPTMLPVGVIAFHGTADHTVPFEGGPVAQASTPVLSAEDMARRWAEINGCPNLPVSDTLPDVDPSDGTRVRRETFAPCNDGSDVVLYVIQNGGHTWPGVDESLVRQHGGKTTHDISATQLIWEFFQDHPRP